MAVADELRPASAQFMDDVAGFAPAREIYERNTAIAAERVRQLILDGIANDAFRDVPTAFIAEVVSSVMVRIQQREVSKNTGLSDAEAYADLANLIVNGIIKPGWRATGGSTLRHPHDQGVALTAAAAQGGRTDAAAAPLQLERQVEHQARS